MVIDRPPVKCRTQDRKLQSRLEWPYSSFEYSSSRKITQVQSLLFLPSFFFLMRTSPSTYLLSRVQSCVCPLLCCGTLEEGVGDRSVAVRTDVGVALLLISGIPHFWDAVPLIVWHWRQCSLGRHVHGGKSTSVTSRKSLWLHTALEYS